MRAISAETLASMSASTARAGGGVGEGVECAGRDAKEGSRNRKIRSNRIDEGPR
jgi:hypothetical protein